MKLGWRVYEYGLIDATFFNSFSGLRDLTIQLPIYKLLSSCHRGPDSNPRGGKTHKISLIFSHHDGERVFLKECFWTLCLGIALAFPVKMPSFSLDKNWR